MKRKLEKAAIALSTLAAVVVSLVWLHSEMVGYDRAWSDAKTRTCGWVASTRGRFVRQGCDLRSRSPHLVTSGTPIDEWPEILPPDFAVGSNPSGQHTVVDCGPFKVPFALPADGLFVGTSTQTAYQVDPDKQTRSSYAWSEFTIAYWLLLALFLIVPMMAVILWVWRQFFPEKVSPSPA